MSVQFRRILIIILVAISAATPLSADPLPGTAPLDLEGDISLEVIDRVDTWLLSETDRKRQQRPHDLLLTAEGRTTLRQRLRHILGLKDSRQPDPQFELVATRITPALIAESDQVSVYAVRWPVLDGVEGAGLLLEPRGTIRANVVAIPDADDPPELPAGLLDDAPAASAWALRLAKAGCRVVIPLLVDRRNDWSGNPRVAMTNQSHREWIYRQAYYVGRHLLGYEIHKIQAAIDCLEQESGDVKLPLGLAGAGEGGLIALYAAALEPRIDSLLISGAFAPLEETWKQPIDRNVWNLLTDFGAAELLVLSDAHTRLIESCQGPELDGQRGPRAGNQAATGRLTTPAIDVVRQEFERASKLNTASSPQRSMRLEAVANGTAPPGSQSALAAFLSGLQIVDPTAESKEPHWNKRPEQAAAPVPDPRQHRQVEQLVEFTQRAARQATFRRAEHWSKADTSSLAAWAQTIKPYREQFRREILGEAPAPSVPANPRSRVIYETADFTGYEVVLDVWPQVIAYGILLVPTSIKAGERCPVVVAQHGRGSRPQDVCDPARDDKAYHAFGARLAERGFVVFAPQNLYLGEEKYRQLQRKATPLGYTFFAPMIRMHERILEWLSGLDFVDSRRIGFYGLSYGGKSAMFLPAAIPLYALSICSGDFNEQVWKHTSLEHRFSFQFTNEHDHTEFNTADLFNYAEVANLIAPRPFMVERGHSDGVGIDEWVAYEYARVKRRYVQLGISERTEIEFFPGGHEIRLQGTLRFLEKHLEPQRR